MQIDNPILVSGQQIKLLLESKRYAANVLYVVQEEKFAIMLYDREEDRYTHALTYTQRAAEGRVPAMKWFKSFPKKELVKLDLLQDRTDLVLSGDIGL